MVIAQWTVVIYVGKCSMVIPIHNTVIYISAKLFSYMKYNVDMHTLGVEFTRRY